MSKPARLMTLVNLLAGKRARTVDEIAERFDVSVRTAYRDLADLSAQHIPLYRSEEGYRLMESAKLQPLNLTAEEHAILKVALHNPALRTQPALARRLDALEAKLDAATALAGEAVSEFRLAGVDRSGPQAKAVFEPLRLAVGGRRTVEMRYESLSGADAKGRGWRKVDPWQIFQRGEAWYLAGWCHQHQEARIFRLDRMREVRGVAAKFEVPKGFKLEEFLAGSWQIYQGAERHRIELRFDEAVAPLIVNARHHEGEQVRRLRSGEVAYEVTLSSLEEIARWVVGFGGQARVVRPRQLAERVTALARGVLAVR